MTELLEPTKPKLTKAESLAIARAAKAAQKAKSEREKECDRMSETFSPCNPDVVPVEDETPPVEILPDRKSPVSTMLEHAYGRPSIDSNGEIDERWVRRNLGVVRLPFPLFCAWRPQEVIMRVRVNRQITHNLANVLEDMLKTIGRERIAKEGLDRFGGAFRFEMHEGALTAAAYGAAITLPTTPETVEIFARHGFSVGPTGNFEAVAR